MTVGVDVNCTPRQSIRAEVITELFATAPDPTDHAAVREYAHRLAGAGLAVLLIRPGQKVPYDARTTAQQIADDNAAQEAAKAAGRRGWKRVKSPAGVYLATSDADELDSYFDEYLGRLKKSYGEGFPVNLAIVPGRSRLVVVDADTAEQLAAFLSDAGLDPDTPPTVRSPGAKDDKGNWVHSDGGHFWFVVPDGVELPENTASYTDANGKYAVMWGMKYVLIPPSVRAEGRYTLTGQVAELPDWLRDRITERAPGQPRVYDRAAAVVGEMTPIDEWSLSIGWQEIMPHGWVPTGRLDSCGCPTWTAPGQHSNPKSATAHEPGCSAAHHNADNPPLHIWTDHPGEPFEGYTARTGRTTLSKLETVALLDFDDKVVDAMETLGLIKPAGVLMESSSGTSGGGRRIRLRPMSDIKDDVPTWVWSYESYGRMMRGTLVIFAGRPAAGKSTAARWFAARLSTGTLEGCFFGKPQRVAYVGTEESYEHLVKPSLRAHGADLERVVQVIVEQDDRERRLLAAEDEHDLTVTFTNEEVTVVIVDPLMSTINGKADINRNNEVREALEPWARIAQAINGVVIGVAHLVKAPPSGDVLAAIQGSSAFGEVARAAFGFAKDPDSDVRVMSQAKNSAGREDLSLEYRIVETEVTTDTGKKAEVARFEIIGTSEITVSDVMREQRGSASGSAKTEVIMWLTKYLASGPRWAAQGYEDAEGAGFSRDQTKRGRSSCGIKSVKAKGDGRFYWATPEQQDAGELPEDDDAFRGLLMK